VISTERQLEFATEVVEKLRNRGYEAYFAGGCVRDQLLGIEPKDYDVATSARPDEIRHVFGHRRTLAIGAAFGVITVRGPKQAGQIEVATFREDLGYSDGRRPDDVRFTSAEHDAMRRDFTINGLFYDPHAGQVLDFVGGREDLNRRIVRAIGEPHRRFTEDKLRMLRAVRFAATFDFTLERDTLQAIRDMASELTVVSAERIGQEMRRMLVHPSRQRAIELLRQATLLDIILPEIATLADAASEQDVRYTETLRVLEALETPEVGLALAALLHETRQPEAAATVGRRWRLSNKEMERAVWLLEHVDEITEAASLPWPQLQRLLVAEGAQDLVALLAAIASTEDASRTRCREALALPEEALNPPPLLTGDDLVAHGLRPGKRFRTLLDAVRDAQLNREIASRDEAIALVERLLEE